VLTISFDDPVQRSITVVQSGKVTWPPPPVPVSAAAPAAAAKPVRSPVATSPTARPARRYALVALLAAALFAITAFAPAQLATNFSVFVLAVVIGYYVIGAVHHALHTPLMSVTNAISGIIIVGALLQLGQGNLLVTLLSFVATVLVAINIFGGFAVTRRMLGMFRKG
jgi:NAD(P) transhydrogenase subunit alpha